MIHRGLWFLKMLLPCFHPVAFRGKVAREARRKGPLPSLSVFTALTEITAKTPPSRQTEPPPLGSISFYISLFVLICVGQIH